MMRIASLVVVLLLASLGTASAECAWVVWTKYRLSEWTAVEAIETKKQCDAALSKRLEEAARTSTESYPWFGVEHFREYESQYFRCLPEHHRPARAEGADAVTRHDRAQHWEHLARSPIAWVVSAEDMRSCAELVGRSFVDDLMSPDPPEGKTTEGVQPISFGPIFQMLAGYSIEALVKGICVAREPNAVVGGRLPKWLTTHDLEALLRRAGVQLCDADQSFVRRLAVSVVWSGRYPVSTRADDMESHKFSSSADLARFLRVYEALMRVLQQEIGQRPPAHEGK